MADYVFAERNGNASICLSESGVARAKQYLKNLGLTPNDWRLETINGKIYYG